MAIDDKIINTSYRKRLGTSQNNAECDVSVEDDNTIGRILAIETEATNVSYEPLDTELKYKGEVCFKVVYTTESGKVACINCSSEYFGKIENDVISTSTVPIINTEVLEVNVVSASNYNLRLNALVQTIADGFITDEVVPFFDETLDLQTKNHNINYMSLVSNSLDQIVLNEKIDLDYKPSQIILANGKAVVTKTIPGSEYYLVEGKISLNIVYETVRDEKTEIKSQIKIIEFKEEVENKNVNKDSILEVYANIRNCLITYEIMSANTKSNQVEFKIPVDLQTYVMEANEIEVLEDAYSTNSLTNFEMESFKKSDKNERFNFTDRVDGSIEFGEEDVRINKILSTFGDNVVVSNSFVDASAIHVEGIAYTNVIYCLDDEFMQVNSVQVEMPFSCTFEINEEGNFDDVFVKACELDVNARLKKGRAIDVDVLLNFDAGVASTTDEIIIKNVSLTEPIEMSDAAMQVYFGQAGDDLWTVSKKLLVDPSVITEQNPDIEFPLEKNESIILFRPKR